MAMAKHDLSSSQAEMRLREASRRAKRAGGKGKMARAMAFLETHSDPSSVGKAELADMFGMNVHTAVTTLYWFNFMRDRRNG